MSHSNFQIHITHIGYHTAPSPTESLFHDKQQWVVASVAEVEKDALCASQLFSLYFMTRKGCTM